LPLAWAAGRVAPGVKAWFTRGLRALIRSAWKPLALAVPTFLTFLPMQFGTLDTSNSFVPELRILVANGVFFGFGWMLFGQADLLPELRRYARRYLLLALVLFVANQGAFGWHLSTFPTPNLPGRLVTAATAAPLTWLLIFGITGLFLR
jgi:hypothetical protein